MRSLRLKASSDSGFSLESFVYIDVFILSSDWWIAGSIEDSIKSFKCRKEGRSLRLDHSKIICVNEGILRNGWEKHIRAYTNGINWN